MMKALRSLLILATLSSLFLPDTNAQISLKTEYFGKSSYRDENNKKVGDSQGAAFVCQGSISLPFIRKMNEHNQPLLWGASLSASYTAFNNDDIADNLVLSKLMNLQISLFHIRPIHEKWQMMLAAGAGVFTPDTRFSHIRMRNILGNIGVLFIRRLSPAIEVGGGVALNNTFGFPMIFPALYFNWERGGQWMCKLSALEGFNLLVGYKLNKFASLHFITEMNGQMALTKQEGKEKIFTHLYIVSGLRPQLTITDKIAIPFTFGMHWMRGAYYDNRSLKSIFKSNRDYDPYFQLSPYVAAGLEISF